MRGLEHLAVARGSALQALRFAQESHVEMQRVQIQTVVDSLRLDPAHHSTRARARTSCRASHPQAGLGGWQARCHDQRGTALYMSTAGMVKRRNLR